MFCNPMSYTPPHNVVPFPFHRGGLLNLIFFLFAKSSRVPLLLDWSVRRGGGMLLCGAHPPLPLYTEPPHTHTHTHTPVDSAHFFFLLCTTLSSPLFLSLSLSLSLSGVKKKGLIKGVVEVGRELTEFRATRSHTTRQIL